MSSLTPHPRAQGSIQPARERVPILTYHSLDDSGAVTSVAPQDFELHMRSLARRGFRAISLCTLVEAWEGRATLPARSVVLTFDDAYANLLPHAAPILKELNFHATVFAVSGRCGATNDWPDQAAGIPRLPLLTWTDLAELADAGWEVGAHTVTHRPLTRLSHREMEDEIVRSQTTITDRLGLPVTTFSYPFGDYNGASRSVVQSHFRAACGVDLSVAGPADDRHVLPRLDVYYFRNPRVFALLETARGRVYLSLRGLGRKMRARLLAAKGRSKAHD